MSSAVSGHVFQTWASLVYNFSGGTDAWSGVTWQVWYWGIWSLQIQKWQCNFAPLLVCFPLKWFYHSCVSTSIDDVKYSLILTNSYRLQSSVLHSIDRLKCATFCTLVINAKVCSLCCLSNVLCIIDLPELSL